MRAIFNYYYNTTADPIPPVSQCSTRQAAAVLEASSNDIQPAPDHSVNLLLSVSLKLRQQQARSEATHRARGATSVPAVGAALQWLSSRLQLRRSNMQQDCAGFVVV